MKVNTINGEPHTDIHREGISVADLSSDLSNTWDGSQSIQTVGQ